jgi:hypothetical protein
MSLSCIRHALPGTSRDNVVKRIIYYGSIKDNNPVIEAVFLPGSRLEKGKKDLTFLPRKQMPN